MKFLGTFGIYAQTTNQGSRFLRSEGRKMDNFESDFKIFPLNRKKQEKVQFPKFSDIFATKMG